MSGIEPRRALLGAAAALLLMMSNTSGQAQPGWGMGGMGGMGGGWGGGLGMMGLGGMMAGACGPRATEFAQWRMNRIEQVVRPTDAQRSKLDELRKAAAKAREITAAACPSEIPASPVARMELMEKRMSAMLEAMKTVRPAFAAFYESLDARQQARFNAGNRGWRRGWRWQQ